MGKGRIVAVTIGTVSFDKKYLPFEDSDDDGVKMSTLAKNIEAHLSHGKEY